MTGDRQDELYVGYLDETPPSVARFVRRIAIGLLLLAVVLGAGLALLLEPFDEGVFEYGTVRDYEGELLVDPHPRLLTADGPAQGYLLVGVGKHGLDVNLESNPPWSPSLSWSTALSGSLIENRDAAMLEVHVLEPPERTAVAGPAVESGAPASPATDRERLDTEGPHPSSDAIPGPPNAAANVVRLRGQTLLGEIVDTKCYLGAMKPGRGKAHRGCASLCISGGIPAALLVRTEDGKRELVHLVDLGGRPLGREILDWVGQPVEVTGFLHRQDDRLFLATAISDGSSAATTIRPYPAAEFPGAEAVLDRPGPPNERSRKSGSGAPGPEGRPG